MNPMRILDVGCGINKKAGAIGVDRNLASRADVIADLDRFPYPFRDSSFDGLQAVHVIEHLLLILAAPTLLLWGAPVRLALSASPPAARHSLAMLLRSRLVRVLTRPACGLALFTAVALTTHLTRFYEAALRNQDLRGFDAIDAFLERTVEVSSSFPAPEAATFSDIDVPVLRKGQAPVPASR